MSKRKQFGVCLVLIGKTVALVSLVSNVFFWGFLLFLLNMCDDLTLNVG